MNVTATAKSAWLARFDGPVLTRKITLGSPLVRHQYKRAFEHVGRNVHMVSVFGRVLLGEEKINEAEVAIYKCIDDVTKALERKVASSKLVVSDAGLADSIAEYNKQVEIDASVVVPAQSKFLKLLELADAYAQNFFTLWLGGEITDKEKSKQEHELKKLLRMIPSTTRKMRVYVQTKLNESPHEDAKKEAAAMLSDVKEDNEDGDGDVAAAAAAVIEKDAVGAAAAAGAEAGDAPGEAPAASKGKSKTKSKDKAASAVAAAA